MTNHPLKVKITGVLAGGETYSGSIPPSDYFGSDPLLPGEEAAFTEPLHSDLRVFDPSFARARSLRVIVEDDSTALSVSDAYTYWYSGLGGKLCERMVIRDGRELVNEKQLILSQDIVVGEHAYLIQRFVCSAGGWVPESQAIYRHSDHKLLCDFATPMDARNTNE